MVKYNIFKNKAIFVDMKFQSGMCRPSRPGYIMVHKLPIHMVFWSHKFSCIYTNKISNFKKKYKLPVPRNFMQNKVFKRPETFIKTKHLKYVKTSIEKYCEIFNCIIKQCEKGVVPMVQWFLDYRIGGSVGGGGGVGALAGVFQTEHPSIFIPLFSLCNRISEFFILFLQNHAILPPSGLPIRDII